MRWHTPQIPDFVFRRNGRVHLNRRGASVQSTTGSRGLRINGSDAGYTMFRGSVKSTGYLLHSPVSPSLPLPCVTVCHHISTGLYIPAVWYSKQGDCCKSRNTITCALILRRNSRHCQPKDSHLTSISPPDRF
jgi:hypothetical protein